MLERDLDQLRRPLWKVALPSIVFTLAVISILVSSIVTSIGKYDLKVEMRAVADELVKPNADVKALRARLLKAAE